MNNVSQERFAEMVTWVMCEMAAGAGPGKCDPSNCVCGAEGEAVARSIYGNGYVLAQREALHGDHQAGIDFSAELAEVRREMRAKLLTLGDQELKDLCYRMITLSEHEAARRAIEPVVDRCNLSNRAEA